MRKGIILSIIKTQSNVQVTCGLATTKSETREQNDYYATPPKAVEMLLDLETFDKNILEPCCGEGHISNVLKDAGHIVTSSDLIDRGYGEVKSIFDYKHFDGDVITNPPYKIALECLEHSYEIINDGNKVAMFLRLQFLEGVARRKFFDVHPPKVVYVPSHRLSCAMNGDFENHHATAMTLCWFIWEKGFTGDPIVRWFN